MLALLTGRVRSAGIRPDGAPECHTPGAGDGAGPARRAPVRSGHFARQPRRAFSSGVGRHDRIRQSAGRTPPQVHVLISQINSCPQRNRVGRVIRFTESAVHVAAGDGAGPAGPAFDVNVEQAVAGLDAPPAVRLDVADACRRGRVGGRHEARSEGLGKGSQVVFCWTSVCRP